jgi:uncharacterized membrane protein YfcA
LLYALLGAVLIGLSLGLLGSGGSMLTVPVLVYLAGEPPKLAIVEGLAIVGFIALAGAVPHAVQRNVDLRSVVFFGLPGMAGAYAGSAVARHVPGAVQLIIFAGVMLAAAAAMVRGRPDVPHDDRPHPAWRVALPGLGVGLLTGLVGVGGGFLIVPALVLLLGVPMRPAIGTSLVIIALNCAAGFAKSLHVLADNGLSVNYRLVILVTAIGIAGSFAGHRLGQLVPQEALRRGFAGFLVLMGAFILWRELPGVLG